MAKIAVGKTGIIAERNGFGALPVQRIPIDDAVRLLRRAYDGGMTYFDTARSYTDSEEKLGAAFGGGIREHITIATKTHAQDAKTFWQHLETSLRLLKTDHIDVYQFHNPAFCPLPGDESGLYDAAVEAKKQGKILHIGITNHRMSVANQAIDSGLYETLQYPFSYLSTPEEKNIVLRCAEKGMGFIAMKALSGGLIVNSAAACAWLAQYGNVLPIWGVQRDWELEEFLSYIKEPPALTAELEKVIENDRAELQGEFCRGCGYCMPCPQGIEINTCARASLLLRRAPANQILSPEGQAKMRKIPDCIGCGQCAAKCPYGLDTPNLLKRNYQDFLEVLAGKEI